MSEIYKDKSFPFEDRARALVEEMTLAEKCSQMSYTAPAVERLGIPAYNWWNEGLHGVARAGTATMFPQAIALAATFDDTLLQTAAEVIAREARAKYNAASKRGDRDIYKGLTLWAPNINLFRDPRWGRGHETYGEDPYLTARMGCAFVRGMQGDGEYYIAAACAKHFAVHSGPESLRHEFDAKVSEKDLEESYLPAFRSLVCEADVAGVMGAYNRVNGEPACAHSYLSEMLRRDWGFSGYFVSDCFAIGDFHTRHRVTKTAEESVCLAVANQCDLNCGNMYLHVQKACEKGLISEEQIDCCVRRLMAVRLRLGLFDTTPYDEIPLTVVASAAHQKVADRCCEKSMVLLQNNGILPLKGDIASIAVIGPNANNRRALVGNYEGTASRYITPLEGIQDAFAGEVYYAKGCELDADRTEPLALAGDRIEEAVAIAEQVDVAILCLGLDAGMEGEEGDEGNQYFSGDREDIALPKPQQELLAAIHKTGTPYVVVLQSGSCLSFDIAHADAIIQMWYAGAKGGKTLADILFGKVSPSGKLPVTFYKSVKLLPEFTDYSMKGRTYRYTKDNVLFPFGFGLSYGNVQIQNLRCIHDANGVKLIAHFENKSDRACEEVVQVYVGSDSKDGVLNVSLCDFERESFAPGACREVSFLLKEESFMLVNDLGLRYIDRSCDYTLYVGCSQPDALSEKLSNKKCLSVTLHGARVDIIYRQVKEHEGKVTDKRVHKGRYLMDYSRQYEDPYDVQEKARKHMQYMRKFDGKKI